MPSKKRSKRSTQQGKHDITSVEGIPLGFLKIVTLLDDLKRAVKRFDDNRADIEEVNELIKDARSIAYSGAAIIAEHGFNEMMEEYAFIVDLLDYARENKGTMDDDSLRNWRRLSTDFLEQVEKFKISYEELEKTFGEQIDLPLDQGGEEK